MTHHKFLATVPGQSALPGRIVKPHSEGAGRSPVVLAQDILVGLDCVIGLFLITAACLSATVELLAGLDEVHVTLPCRHAHQPAPVLAVLRSLCFSHKSAISTATRDGCLVWGQPCCNHCKLADHSAHHAHGVEVCHAAKGGTQASTSRYLRSQPGYSTSYSDNR